MFSAGARYDIYFSPAVVARLLSLGLAVYRRVSWLALNSCRYGYGSAWYDRQCKTCGTTFGHLRWWIGWQAWPAAQANWSATAKIWQANGVRPSPPYIGAQQRE